MKYAASLKAVVGKIDFGVVRVKCVCGVKREKLEVWKGSVGFVEDEKYCRKNLLNLRRRG